MAEWDTGRLYAVPQQLTGGVPKQEQQLSHTDVRLKTMEFVRLFARNGLFVYRENLLKNARDGKYALEIDLVDFKGMFEDLADLIVSHPAEYIPHIETALRDLLLGMSPELNRLSVPVIQVHFVGMLPHTPIRLINAEQVNKLLRVPGIVIQAQRTKCKALTVCFRCKTCSTERMITVPPGFGNAPIPRNCTGRNADNAVDDGLGMPAADCGQDPFMVVPDKCVYVDQQILKLQEAPEEVPTGELPRHIMLTVDRHLADTIPPGSRITVMAIACVFRGMTSNASPGNRASARMSVGTSYLRVVGADYGEGTGGGRALATFSAEEENTYRYMAADPSIFNRMASSVAPSISGDYTEDIKRAILCLLLGGSRKLLPDGTRLRGDINVLLLGDPSTAKSQFLKFVEKVAPVGVYTSGKGSSAAGLTASVLKSPSGEFFLEGGAMVMADGGVVCIDEFDKMREEDRVAIHEAMEQQTISVAKAGITTILNSRCSVLAAANPVFGRYDDSKSATENIDLLPTILSRFDLIFIVRDTRNTERDKAIAQHVVNVHVNFREMGSGDAGAGAGAGVDAPGTSVVDVEIGTMKKFITFARNKCAPRLTEEAGRSLQSKYAEIRAHHAAQEQKHKGTVSGESGNGTVIPITVRQLEALVRITESIAKASLRTEAGSADVDEAVRLFTVSTLAAAAAGLVGSDQVSPDIIAKVKAAEARIIKFVMPGDRKDLSKVKERVMSASINGTAGSIDESIFNLAVAAMERRAEIKLVSERKVLQRLL